MGRLRIVFIGQNSPYTLRPLRAAADSHDIVGVVESAPKGYEADVELAPSRAWTRRLLRSARRRLFPFSYGPLRRYALSRDLPFFFLIDGRSPEFLEFLRGLRPDVVCVASMSQLMTASALAVPALGAINIHASLLPKYRGPLPWFWQIHDMDMEGGVTVHFIDEGVDTGNILRQEAFPIALGTRSEELLEVAAAAGERLLPEALRDVIAGSRGKAQRHLPCPFYARRVLRNEPLLHWRTWPIERVWHVLRGASPWLPVSPPPDGWRAGLAWRVEGFSKEPVYGVPGTICHDGRGAYLAHPQGKIRLAVDYGPLRSLSYWKTRILGD